MKRLVFCGLLAGALILLEAAPAHVATDKGPTTWQTVEAGFKVLKLWEQRSLGPKEPEIAILQLSEDKQKELEHDPLGFLRKYKVFPKVDVVRGHFTLRLPEDKAPGKDPAITVVVHDPGTYAGFASFEINAIKE
jgi:hypothetical protein